MDHHYSSAVGYGVGQKARSGIGARAAAAGADLHSPQLSLGEVELLRALSERREEYLMRGQGREAHAMAAAMQIVWRKLCEPDPAVERPHLQHAKP